MHYIDEEQATLTLNNVSELFLKKNLKSLLNETKKLNIKLVYINLFCSQDIDVIQKIAKDEVNVFIRTDVSCLQKKILNHIIKCSFQDFKKNKVKKDVYYEIEYSYELLDFLKKNEKMLKQIILGIPDTMLSADEIFKELSFTNRSVMFNEPIISLNTLKEHPCNAYLCSGVICHGGKGNLLRQLVIDEEGRVMINGLDDFILGNIGNNSLSSILMEYKNSQQHLEFIELNRKSFVRYVLSNLVKTLVWNNCVRSVR